MSEAGLRRLVWRELGAGVDFNAIGTEARGGGQRLFERLAEAASLDADFEGLHDYATCSAGAARRG
jgi:hypothetical protein